MAACQEQFKRILDEAVGDYAARALLSRAIQAKGLVRSEAQPAPHEVVGATARHVASMGIFFEHYGRSKDTKGISRTNAPPIEEIEVYVKNLVVSYLQYMLSCK
jgi:hypothetical protein